MERAMISPQLLIGAIKDAFNSAFGAGAGDRVRLSCKRDGSRQLITEITIGLGARPDGGYPTCRPHQSIESILDVRAG